MTTTVPRRPATYQSNRTSDTDKVLVGALVLVVMTGLGSLVYVVKLAGNITDVATVVVPAISAIVLAAVSAIAVVLRRSGRNRRS
jgi:hypothetical protein